MSERTFKIGDKVKFNSVNLWYEGYITHVYEDSKFVCVQWNDAKLPRKEWAPNLKLLKTPNDA